MSVQTNHRRTRQALLLHMAHRCYVGHSGERDFCGRGATALNFGQQRMSSVHCSGIQSKKQATSHAYPCILVALDLTP